MNLKTTFLGAVALTAFLASPAAAQTEIQWWHAFDGRLAEVLNGQVQDFNALQSEYKVIPVYKGNYSETLNAGITAFRAGEQPHILQVFEVGTATMMAAEGAINPVYEVMEMGGRKFDPSVYLPPVVGYYTTPEGDMLSLPYNSSTPVMYYNKDAFKAAGLDPENPPATWGEFEGVVRKLKDSGIDCPFTTSWQSWVHLENFGAWHDIPFATNENGFTGLDTELVFNDPVRVKHIAFLGDLAEEDLFIYGGRRNEAGVRFRGGDCAILTESSAGYGSISRDAKFDFGVARLPYWDDVEGAPQNTIIGGASLWVLKGHSNDEYEGVAEFFSYLSRPQVQASWHQNTGYLPITLAAAELTREQGYYDENPGTDIAIKQMTGKKPTENSKGLRLGNFDQIRTVIDEELEAVWQGKKSAQAALDSAVERGNEILRRFEEANE